MIRWWSQLIFGLHFTAASYQQHWGEVARCGCWSWGSSISSFSCWRSSSTADCWGSVARQPWKDVRMVDAMVLASKSWTVKECSAGTLLTSSIHSPSVSLLNFFLAVSEGYMWRFSRVIKAINYQIHHVRHVMTGLPGVLSNLVVQVLLFILEGTKVHMDLMYI